ncbi:helix-turn-helix domain-containing protein [Actinacidiphila epipremni]|uniref:Helix-turn-helix domain-containing protein n=1 Tax=Actinacidiphila epipremni TaxID=2053013 RepID=A0ABX0ZJG7_9ACTN|nr:helix-turn-helix transcriptional regulator [Actinacidiphila epipremni]NJP42339.1 helix-turn-helix domain-containing protein [Actinacidiphila epipremni]
MPLRSTATARQERLGAELRKMREAAGITARDTARLLGTDPAKVSHIEAGRLGVSEERLRRLASFYQCGDGALIDALVAMANGLGRKGWWEAYRGVVPAAMLDIAELEYYATGLRTIQITHIPGVFQTEDYTRTVFGYVIPPLPTAELEARVAHRMERTGVLYRDSAPPYEAVIHEAALRMRFGGTKITRAQLDHLMELSHLPHISVRIVPFAGSGYIGTGHASLYTFGAVQALDTVQIDTAHGVTFLHAAPHLLKYRTHFERLAAGALDESQSRDFILSASRDL